MAASEKTILSDLEAEEGACKDGKLLNRGGDNNGLEDSSIFKSFFESEDVQQQSDKLTVTSLVQSCNPEGIFVADRPTMQIQQQQLCSDNSSDHLDLTACEKESVKIDLIERTDCKVGQELSSEPSQSQCDIRLSTGTTVDSFKSESSSPNEKAVFVIDEKDNSEILDSKKLESYKPNTDCSLFDCLETENRNSNSFCGDQSSFENEKMKSSNTGSQESFEGCSSHKSKESLPKINGERCEKENSDYSNDEKTASIKPLMLDEGVNIPASMEGLCERKPMFEKVANASDTNYDSKKVDPFTLSGDEDFSPKAYKPIKRKLNQVSVDLKACGVDMLDSNSNSEEKKQKLIEEEDLSFSDMSGRKPVSVAYVHSKELVDKANKLIRIEGRAQLVHSLIEVYGILQHVDVIPPRLATETEITGFHCSEYVGFLKSLTDSEDLSESSSAEAEAYGLSYDCPVQEDVFETASLISGATIRAAESLINGTASIAINWCGGWHHAKRDSASGFCYINDIVLGILKLREKFERVLYVDLDLHHGDGVEEAFYMTPKVMTVSFHKFACGFFPGSGSVEDTGSGRGRLYSINVPLMDGIGDKQFFSVFTSVMKKVRDKFNAEAIVIQCGADSLSEDPMASFNLTHVAIAKCVCFLLTWSLPTLLLGGGGYNFPNTAKCWTFLTAMAAGKKLPVDIPEHEHLMDYGPSFEMTTSQGNRKDCNTKEHFYDIMAKICKNLNCL